MVSDKKYVVPERYRPKPRDPNKKPEKMWGCTVGAFFGLLGVFVAKYLVDFWLLPKLFPALYPFSAGAVIVWLVSTLVFTIVSMKLISGLIYFYYVADIVYAILVAIWSLGLYGAEMISGPLLALVMLVVLYFLQRLILWAVILFSFIRN